MVYFKYTLHALDDTLVRISPRDCVRSFRSRNKMIKLILVDFDVNNANIALKMATGGPAIKLGAAL